MKKYYYLQRREPCHGSKRNTLSGAWGVGEAMSFCVVFVGRLAYRAAHKCRVSSRLVLDKVMVQNLESWLICENNGGKMVKRWEQRRRIGLIVVCY